jgi:predicted nicotinamide N-methyase
MEQGGNTPMPRQDPTSPLAVLSGDAALFIRDNTRPLRPPLVPELVLHLAEESLPIWRRTEEELGEQGVPPPYWAFAWAGGQALARYILDNPGLVAGRTALDIGSGSGLVALAAAMAGASHVIANDIDAFACEACRLNAAANALALEISSEDILSHATDDRQDEPPPHPAGVVTLADVFYERDLARAATMTAEAHHKRGATVLVGDPCRSYFPSDRFEMIADYRVPVTRELEDSEIKATAVWRLVD